MLGHDGGGSDALQAINGRRVQRAFDPRPVDPDALAKIVEAGRHAMSARNLQPWQFIVVRDRTRLQEIGGLCATGKFVADAPAAVVVLQDVANARWADVDCAQAVQNMSNAAWALGPGGGLAMAAVSSSSKAERTWLDYYR